MSKNASSNRRGFNILAWCLVVSAIVLPIGYFTNVIAALTTLCVLLSLAICRISIALWKERRSLQIQMDWLRGCYDPIVAVLCGALGLRDNFSGEHAQRVSHMVSVVAWELGLRKEQIRLIEAAAILHDIGKIGVAQVVLSKPGSLSDQEWEEMKRHAEVGHQILNGINFLQGVAEIVHSHHERFDGQGYPQQLRGDDIPLGSRIFAVVDAYVAMTTKRPYRKAIEHDMAIREIVRNSLTQFDPQVVDAFVAAENRGLIGPAVAPEPTIATAPEPVSSEV